MSIFKFGSFTDVFDVMLINLLDPKTLFSLTQVNKYYNNLITNALPTAVFKKYSNAEIINRAMRFNNNTLLEKMMSKIDELDVDCRLKIMCNAYHYNKTLIIDYMFNNKLNKINKSDVNSMLFSACVKGNTIGVKHIIHSYRIQDNEMDILACIAAYYNHKDIFNMICYYDDAFNNTIEFDVNYKTYKTHPFILALSNGNYDLAEDMFKCNYINSYILDIALQTINLRDVALKHYHNMKTLFFINEIVIKQSDNMRGEDTDGPQDITDFDTQKFLDYVNANIKTLFYASC